MDDADMPSKLVDDSINILSPVLSEMRSDADFIARKRFADIMGAVGAILLLVFFFLTLLFRFHWRRCKRDISTSLIAMAEIKTQQETDN